jgi:hypothetical protein
MSFKMSGWSAFTKTIAKNAGVEKFEEDEEVGKARNLEKRIYKKEDQGDFVPAWPGADISEEKWNSMSQKEKDDYTEKHGD